MHHSQEAVVDWRILDELLKHEGDHDDTNREAYQDTMLLF
jgi:hypothetical protein